MMPSPRAQATVAAVLADLGDFSALPAPPVDAPPAVATAPANVALVKYWGKRDEDLKLPVTGSLSISLDALQTTTRLSRAPDATDPAIPDQLLLASAPLAPGSPFAARLRAYLDLFRPSPAFRYRVDTANNFPTAAGLASSASGFAALAIALDRLWGWHLPPEKLSILARLGSGSAARSIHTGFVEWLPGMRPDGLDSYAVKLADPWPDLRLATLLADPAPKPVGSGEGMRRTVRTSFAYAGWPARVAADLDAARAAIAAQDLPALGALAEANCLAMHALMWTARPPLVYQRPATLQAMHDIWAARADGIRVWFTMDAGPNLKLLVAAPDLPPLRVRLPLLRPL